jgi:hypothetical protein
MWKSKEAEKLAELLCPVHAHLDEIGKLADFDNCIACIRVQRDELLQKVKELEQELKDQARAFGSMTMKEACE